MGSHFEQTHAPGCLCVSTYWLPSLSLHSALRLPLLMMKRLLSLGVFFALLITAQADPLRVFIRGGK